MTRVFSPSESKINKCPTHTLLLWSIGHRLLWALSWNGPILCNIIHRLVWVDYYLLHIAKILGTDRWCACLSKKQLAVSCWILNFRSLYSWRCIPSSIGIGLTLHQLSLWQMVYLNIWVQRYCNSDKILLYHKNCNWYKKKVLYRIRTAGNKGAYSVKHRYRPAKTSWTIQSIAWWGIPDLLMWLLWKEIWKKNLLIAECNNFA